MESNQQFSLRWNNYLHHITDAFDSLREDETLVDVTLCCEGKKIKAHRMLLSACSSYFREIFKENPCQHPVVVFHNVRYEDLLALVAFMYRGEVNVEQECLSSFLNTAELLEVKGLTCSTGRDKVDEAEAEECAEVKSPRKQSSPKPHRPESPGSNRKRKVLVSEEPPSPENHSPLARVKAEFSPADLYTSELHSDSMDQRAHSLSHKIKLENTLDISFSGENSDGTSEQPDTLGLPGGSSNDMTGVPEALQAGQSQRQQGRLLYTCGECGKTFKHSGSLSMHKRLHIGDTYCRFCGRVFSRKYYLKLHMKMHHFQGPPAPVIPPPPPGSES